MSWTPNVRIEGQLSNTPPSLAALGYELQMVHIGDSSTRIWHSRLTDGSWTSNTALSLQSKASPALVEANGIVHMIFVDKYANTLWHSSFDGSAWEPPVPISGQKVRGSTTSVVLKTPAVALAELNGTFHMVYVNEGIENNWLWHAQSKDARVWSQAEAVTAQLSKATPALAAFGEMLHMVHIGNVSNKIWYSTWDGQSWSPNVAIESQLSKASPALASSLDALHMVHLGDQTNRIWYSQFVDGRWTPNVLVEGQRSHGAPSLGALPTGQGHREIHMVHQGDSTNRLWYSQLT